MASSGSGGESRVRQNYHADCEAGFNKQINIELYASYVYLSMSYYFERDDVALKGFAKWCRKASDEEREHAMKCMQFQNDRGGKIVLQDISKPEKDDWGSALQAMEAALALERFNNDSLLQLHNVADKHSDHHMADFIEETFLGEQVHAIKELSDMITNLKRVGTGLGEFMFDKEHFEDS